MPLPEKNCEWPPQQHSLAYKDYQENAAWYAGDVEKLAAIYTPGAVAVEDARFSFRAQYQYGFIGRLKRFFWGTPFPPGAQDNKLHVPAASDIATMSSDLLFYHPPTFHVDPEISNAEATQARLEDLFDQRAMATLSEAAETCSAMSGVFIRCGVVPSLEDSAPIMDVIQPDAAIPTFSWGRLQDVTLWRILKEDKDNTWRHLEFHAPGYVQHGLYKGTKDELGKMVPLEDMPETAVFGPEVDEMGRIFTGIDDLDVIYIPNVKPNRKHRNKPQLSCLGRSDFDGIFSMMDALDESYTSWMRDLRLGKGRIMVPQSYLDTWGKGQGGSFNLDKEVFVEMNMLDSESRSQITVSQFAIRFAEHQATCQEWWERIISGAGYSAQTFGFAGEMAMTATESNARERKSMITRAKKIRFWQMGLAEVAEVMLKLDNAHFRGTGEALEPDVEFPEFLQDTMQTRAQTAQYLANAKAASTEVLVGLVHPDWDEDRIAAEAALIKDETAPPPIPDPMQGFGDA